MGTLLWAPLLPEQWYLWVSCYCWPEQLLCATSHLAFWSPSHPWAMFVCCHNWTVCFLLFTLLSLALLTQLLRHKAPPFYSPLSPSVGLLGLCFWWAVTPEGAKQVWVVITVGEHLLLCLEAVVTSHALFLLDWTHIWGGLEDTARSYGVSAFSGDLSLLLMTLIISLFLDNCAFFQGLAKMTQ